MRRFLAGVSCAIAAFSAYAQYNGPAVETCRAYAKREVARDGTSAKDVVLESQSINIERYTRKLGNQFVSSILTGNGAVVLDAAPSIELSFICLLADEKRAVFFEWLPRAHPSALQQCTRDEALRRQPRPCLETLQLIADNDLGQLYALRFADARELDYNAKNDAAVTAYRKANEEWLQYREAECARRRAIAPHGISPDDFQLACTIDLTRRRALDMR